MKPFVLGDYVLATKFRGGDPGDHWCVGWFAGMLPKLGGDRYEVVDSRGNLFRGNGFRRACRISPDAGKWLLDHRREMSQSRRSVWGWLRVAYKEIKHEASQLNPDELALRITSARPFKFATQDVPLVIVGRKTQSRRLERKFDVGELFYIRSTSGAEYPDQVFEVTRVWSESVQSISHQDMLAEGIDLCNASVLYIARERFRRIIDRHYPSIWESNGLVWAHEWRPLMSNMSAIDEK